MGGARGKVNAKNLLAKLKKKSAGDTGFKF